jgi:tight adherence protein B
MDPTPYDSLVAQVGGQALATDNPAKVNELTNQSGTAIISKQYTLAYNSGLKSQDVSDIAMTVGSATSTASFILGGVYQGNSALRPNVVSPAAAATVFQNKGIFAVALVLALLAAAGFAYALTSLFVKDDLSDVLQPYADPYGDEDEEAGALGNSAIMKRAVELTEQVAESQGFLTRAEGALERANLPLRAGEALVLYVVIVILVTVVGLFLTRTLVGGILFGVVGALLPVTIVNFLAKRRRKAFMGQLPDTLSLLSGTLRAGYSLMQGVEAVSQEVDDPMGIELRRVVTEARLGRPLEESLEASADRMDSPDFAWAVMAIRIQREVGGNLSELLMTVADTMIARERLRRDVAALTAEGRVSAVILGALPAGLGLLMYVLNPEYVGVLFTDGLGIGMLIAAVVSMLIGFLWMKKIITIEI